MAFEGQLRDQRGPAAAAPPETTPRPPSDATETTQRALDAWTDGLLFGSKWAEGVVSYSDPDRAADYGGGYWADDDGDFVSAQHDGFARFTPAQMAVAHATLNTHLYSQPPGAAGLSVEGFTGLEIAYAGPGAGNGILRYANSGDPMPPGNTAYAYYPDPWGSGGDAWFDEAGSDPVAGNYDYMAIVHETGHALGLKHGHETGGFTALPGAWDALEFSVMTYRTYIGATPDFYKAGAVDFPQTFMMLDIAALQHLYGADFDTSAGDTTYSWSQDDGSTFVDGELAIAPAGNRIFQTIWDGGGSDTYDLSSYRTDLRIDLTPGGNSTFDPAQLADLGGGPNGGYARGSVFNALQFRGDPRSLIENARGGTGDDALSGNPASNHLEGNAGDDRMAGHEGADWIEGGAGDDALRGGRGADRLAGGAGQDLLVGGPGWDRFEFDSVIESPRELQQWDTVCVGGNAGAFDAPGVLGGDLIDLRDIDATANRPGNQAFLFDGVGRGHLRLVDHAGDTLVCADTEGSRRYDFVLRIADGEALATDYTGNDFLL